MKLNKEQHEQFDRDGYLFFPGLFTPDEARTLTDAVPELYSRREAYNVREKGSDAVRTNFAAHLYSEPFARLARHPRMIEPVEDLFGEKLYMHQFKINGKMAFEGDVWQWHQDYGTWLNDDMMPTERAMNVAIFLDDVNEFNGPLMFIPGSHKKGVVDAKHDLTTTSYPLWTVDNALITQLVDARGGKNGGIVSPKGPAGSMILFHSCLVHASTSNLSPWNRVSVYLSLCAVSNHIRRFKRPEYIAHRDFTPIECLPTTACSRTIRWTCPGRTACRPAHCHLAGTHRLKCPEGRMNLHSKLRQRAAEGRPVRVGLIGAGKFGSMYLAQIPRTPGVHLVGIADLSPDGARANLARVGWSRADPGRITGRRAVKSGQTHIGDDWQALVRHPAIDVIVECTGHPIAAVDHCLEAFATASMWST
jgi:ectoine hydroxylase